MHTTTATPPLEEIDLEQGDERSAVSVSGMLVAFNQLKYVVKASKQNHQCELALLNKISGYFEPGKLTALIGPSGSGKSTLLDILSARKSSGMITGTVTYNGLAPTPGLLKAQVGYVEQFDTLLPELTVREMLGYAAAFKLKNITRKQIDAKIDEVIRMLQLQKCEHTIIGDNLHRGISGGQAKRVNIGLSLITSPSVIFLDEPTSGLDSATADSVIECLRDLADQGHTVVATIHSPSSYAFNLFDSLVLLKQGSVIYQGSLECDAAHAKDFFHQQGFHFPSTTDRSSGAVVPITVSSVEWIVETVSSEGPLCAKHQRHNQPQIGATAASDPTADPATGACAYDFAAAYERSALCRENRHRCEQLVAMAREQGCDIIGAPGADADARTTAAATAANGRGCGCRWLAQLAQLVHATRTLLYFRGGRHLRSPAFLAPRCVPPIFFALMLWSLYPDIGARAATDAAAAQSVSGLFFVTIVLCGFGASSYLPSFYLDRPVFYRDRADGFYGSGAYVIAKLVEDAVVTVATALGYSLIVYYGCGLRGSFGVFFAVRFLAAMVGVLLAYGSAAVSPSMGFACALLPAVVTVCQFLAGFLIVFSTMPSGWHWFYYINFMSYGFAALMVNEYAGETVETGPAAVRQLELYNLAASDGFSLGNDPSFCIAVQVIVGAVVLVLTVLALAFVRHGSR